MAKSLHILLGTSACLQWLCYSGERTVARGPLIFLSRLCPFPELWAFEKIWMKSCQQNISKTVEARVLKFKEWIGSNE